MNKYLTFRDAQQSVPETVLLFSLVSVSCFFVNWRSCTLALSSSPHYLKAKVLAVGLSFLLNYAGQSPDNVPEP
jgi:putative flippase GtrA